MKAIGEDNIETEYSIAQTTSSAYWASRPISHQRTVTKPSTQTYHLLRSSLVPTFSGLTLLMKTCRQSTIRSHGTQKPANLIWSTSGPTIELINPYYTATAARITVSSFTDTSNITSSEPDVFNSENGYLDLVMTCSITSYSVNYTWYKSSIRNVTVAPTEQWYPLGAIPWYTVLQYGQWWRSRSATVPHRCEHRW